jgi:glycosyltransferase involved in cell wall biosynthesis
MKASILINNYNYGQYLDECIKSALNQTYNNCEVILYDDGSNDNSINIARKYSDRIKIIAKENFSEISSFNQANAIGEAFLASTGGIICLLDSDDVFFPNKVEEIIKEFNENPDAVLVQHLFEEIDKYSKPTGVIRPEIRNGIPRNIIYKECTLTCLFAQTSALSFRRSYLKQVLPIKEDKNNKIWPDVRLTRQTVFYGDTITIRKPLTKYRVHGTNDSLKNQDFNHYKSVIIQMYTFFNEVALEHSMPVIPLRSTLEYKNIRRNIKRKRFRFYFNIKDKVTYRLRMMFKK